MLGWLRATEPDAAGWWLNGFMLCSAMAQGPENPWIAVVNATLSVAALVMLRRLKLSATEGA